MSKKTWIIFIALLAGFFGLVFFYSNANKMDLEGIDIYKVISNNDKNGGIEEHVYGKKDSKVVLVEYGDYQCAGCGSMSKKIKTLSEEYKDQLTVVFRNYTMDGHSNSMSAAAAAESAGLQGKYWEMHDLIYENQADWSTAGVDERNELYFSYADKLGLNRDQFIEDMKSDKVRKKIEFDKATAKEANLDATPYFLIDGQKVDTNTWGEDDKFREKINEVLKKNGINPPAKKASDDK